MVMVLFCNVYIIFHKNISKYFKKNALISALKRFPIKIGKVLVSLSE